MGLATNLAGTENQIYNTEDTMNKRYDINLTEEDAVLIGFAIERYEESIREQALIKEHEFEVLKQARQAMDNIWDGIQE